MRQNKLFKYFPLFIAVMISGNVFVQILIGNQETWRITFAGLGFVLFLILFLLSLFGFKKSEE